MFALGPRLFGSKNEFIGMQGTCILSWPFLDSSLSVHMFCDPLGRVVKVLEDIKGDGAVS